MSKNYNLNMETASTFDPVEAAVFGTYVALVDLNLKSPRCLSYHCLGLYVEPRMPYGLEMAVSAANHYTNYTVHTKTLLEARCRKN